MRSEHITLDAAFAALNAAAPAYDRFGTRGTRMHCFNDHCVVSVDVPATWAGLAGTTTVVDGRIVIVEYRGVSPVEAVNGCLAALDTVARAAAEVSA